MSATDVGYPSLAGQPQVRALLERAVSSGQVSHAYLFVGPAGSGKTETAFAFAASILCPNGGCGACDDCIRVAHRTHPDVRFVSPGGVSSYTVDQVREIVRDTQLAPIRSAAKVYILDRADLLSKAAANAFLKTLEEPPSDVVFILLARTSENVLATIRSRCQAVRFHQIPADAACRYLEQETGTDRAHARMALAAGSGSLSRAREFLVSPSRKSLAQLVLQTLGRLPRCDDLDVLEAAARLLEAIDDSLSEVRVRQRQESERGRDYFDRTALRAIEKRQKRELSAGQRRRLQDVFSITRSWLRDCLLVCQGLEREIVYVDDAETLARAAALTSTERIPQALRATAAAERQISYNVTPQLVVETMLFEIRKAFL